MDWRSLISSVPLKRRGVGQQSLTWPYLVAFAGVCLLMYVGGLWWLAQTSAKQQRANAVARAEMLADQLSSGIEPLLASGELSPVRRLITEAGYQQQLVSCRLLMPDGRPIADADLDRPQMTVMPVTWPSAPAESGDTRVINGEVHVERPVPVPAKGEAMLSIVMPLPPNNALIQPALPGVAMIGLGGLAGMLLIIRKMRKRLAVLTLIRSALQDAGTADELDLSSLAVNPTWGKEAEGWNRLIATKQLQQQTSVEQALELLNTQHDGGTLEDACEGLGSGLVLADARGRVVYLNSAAAAALLMDQDVAPGMPLSPMLADEALVGLVEQVQSGNGPGRVRHEMSLGSDGEESTIRVTLRRLTDSGGMVMLLEDVTQQRVADASRHDFVNRATHELRTPLTNIRLYVETAQTDGEEDKELRGECLNVINRESQRLERLVNEMLSVSEIEAGSLTIRRDDVRLDQLFKSLEQDYKQNASQKNIDLRFDLPPKLPAIQGDRDKLAIVAQNLLGNAIKYTPEGGEVSIGVDLSPTELVIEVRDSGIGISEEDQQHVFEKFYRANDPRLGDITGSGLGLALAHEIIRLHGGELSVESELNEGSTFRVVLPIAAEGV